MAGGWQNLIADLNTFFGNSMSRKQLGSDFRTNHGNNGLGAGGKPPYNLGRFLENGNRPGTNTPILTAKQKGQFLIDAGARHWDAQSLMNIEEAIRRNLTRQGTSPGQFDEKKIVFKITTQAGATRATATVKEMPASATEPDPYTEIEIKCPP
jgi:hypothetical protein